MAIFEDFGPLDTNEHTRVRKKNDKQIDVLSPQNMNDAKEVVDNVLSGHVVLMKIVELDDISVNQITGFVAGACYVVDGTMKEVSKDMIIVAPSGVKLSDLK